MAIDQDEAVALRGYIEHIRNAEIIPDPEDEAVDGEEAQPIKWNNGKIEKYEDKEFYYNYVPLTDAMAPDFPKGEYAIFREQGGGKPEPKDGDTVMAVLCVPGIPDDGFIEFRELARVIRRYSRLTDGRTHLAPLKEGFGSWTDGDLTQYGLLDIWVMGVAVPHRGMLVNPQNGAAIFIPTSSDLAVGSIQKLEDSDGLKLPS